MLKYSAAVSPCRNESWAVYIRSFSVHKFNYSLMVWSYCKLSNKYLGQDSWSSEGKFLSGFVMIKLVLHHCSHPHESVYIFIPVHPVPIFLCHPFLTMRSMSLFVCDFFPHFLSSVFLLPPLSVTVMLSQTYDDIDLENEPWYKFFSELEFGRPVSQGHSCSHNHNPVTGIHPLSPLHPCFFFFFNVSTNWMGGASRLGMWYLLGAVTPPPLWQAMLCLWVAGFFVWFFLVTIVFTNFSYWKWSVIASCPK